MLTPKQKFPLLVRDLFWGSSLQHPQTLLGCVRTSRIQSLTLKPVLADPASWWMEEEGSAQEHSQEAPPPTTSLPGQLRLV